MTEHGPGASSPVRVTRSRIGAARSPGRQNGPAILARPMSVEQIPADTAPRTPRARRAASSLTRGAADQMSLPVLRAALLAEVASHHPQADLGEELSLIHISEP